MNQNFPERYKRCSDGNVKVELDLSNYVMKADLKGATCIHTSMLASEIDLASLKIKVDNLDIDKFKTFPVDLSKLSNIVDNDVMFYNALR